MKKIAFIILTVALASCAKIDYYGGSEERGSSIAENYLLIMATDLLPDYLIALESSLSYDTYGYYLNASGQSDYETGGKSIRVPGNSWTVSSKHKVSGLSITCKGNDTWDLYREGPYKFFNNEKDDGYTTMCKMTAQIIGEVAAGHYNWKVTFTGGRTEREGYSCTFESSPLLEYTCTDAKSYAWDYCNGSATLVVNKNGEKVDMARMDYTGRTTRFFRGL